MPLYFFKPQFPHLLIGVRWEINLLLGLLWALNETIVGEGVWYMLELCKTIMEAHVVESQGMRRMLIPNDAR